MKRKTVRPNRKYLKQHTKGLPPPPSLSVSLPIPESHPSREYTAYTGFGQVYYRVPWLFLINRQENQSRVD